MQKKVLIVGGTTTFRVDSNIVYTIRPGVDGNLLEYAYRSTLAYVEVFYVKMGVDVKKKMVDIPDKYMDKLPKSCSFDTFETHKYKNLPVADVALIYFGLIFT